MNSEWIDQRSGDLDLQIPESPFTGDGENFDFSNFFRAEDYYDDLGESLSLLFSDPEPEVVEVPEIASSPKLNIRKCQQCREAKKKVQRPCSTLGFLVASLTSTSAFQKTASGRRNVSDAYHTAPTSWNAQSHS